jgi:hypothetical protein
MAAPRKTHCKRGHPFDESNTFLRPNGSKHCRACHALREKLKYRAHVLGTPSNHQQPQGVNQ